MISIEKIAEWFDTLERVSKIEERKLNSEEELEIHTYPLDITIGDKTIFLGLDSRGQRHLLIPIEQSLIVEDKQTYGVHITKTENVLEEGVTTYELDVKCVIPRLNDIFNHFLLDILTKISEISSSKINILCLQILEKWRLFFKKEKSKKLPEKKIVGLFGELYLLNKFLSINPNADAFWFGPNKNDYDFISGDTAIEVKTTLRKEGRIYEISSINQLLTPQNGELYFYSLKLRKKDNGLSIFELLNEIFTKIIDKTSILDKLGEIGFDFAANQEAYENLRFGIQENEELLYYVDENFPRITRFSFNNNNLPNGVISLKYNIDISAEPPVPLKEEDFNEFLIEFCKE